MNLDKSYAFAYLLPLPPSCHTSSHRHYCSELSLHSLFSFAGSWASYKCNETGCTILCLAFFLYSVLFLRYIHIVFISNLFFIILNIIILSEYTTIYYSIPLFVGLWGCFQFGYWIKLLKHYCSSLLWTKFFISLK